MSATAALPQITTTPLAEMRGGWFVGAFTPTLAASPHAEVAVKYYRAGDNEPRHVHRIATEYTVVTAGCVEMNGVRHEAGTIVCVPPGCATDFRALTDACTTVVKLPSVAGDKYPAPAHA